MKSKTRTRIIALALFAAAVLPLLSSAQEQMKGHHHYKLIDLDTLGGPASYLSNGFDGILNNQGMLVGWADTSTPESNPAACVPADCFVVHAFETRRGVLVDLGALPGGDSSQPTWISANGLISGISQIAESDPSIPGGPPEVRAVLWRDGVPINLGVFPGGGFDTLASAVNSRGQVAGWGLNETVDSFSLAAPGFFTTETRAFLWQHGAMQDLGTLGGSDAFATNINERGQIAGMSYVNSTPNKTTGIPTQDPFLWQNGEMLDLGTLGGTLSFVTALDDRGEVVGQSNLAGDSSSHPFLWTKDTGMQDLGTLGGNNGVINWINNNGDISGKADLAGPLPQNHDAVMWRHGEMIDLGTLSGDSCSNGYYVNARGQVVGTSESRDLCLIPTGEHAFLWENGGPMVDLNTLIPTGSSLQLTFAVAINDRGEIAGFGSPSGCDPTMVETCGHAYILIPCDENHPNIEGCDYSLVDEEAAEIRTPLDSFRRDPSSASPAVETSGRSPEIQRSPGGANSPINQMFRRRFGSARPQRTPQASALTTNTATNLVITSGAPPRGTVGRVYDFRCAQIPPCNIFEAGYSLTAAGGVPPYSWSWAAAQGSSIPSGLGIVAAPYTAYFHQCINVKLPAICGKPTVAGTYHVIVRVADSSSPPVHASATYSITIFQ